MSQKNRCELDEKHIQKMIHLAMFEEIDGKEDIEISKYFRSDYIWIGFLKNFFLITIAYIILLGFILIYNFEYFAVKFADINFTPIIIGGLIFYGIILGIYTVIVYVMRRLRYDRAVLHMQTYYSKLKELSRYYRKTNIK